MGLRRILIGLFLFGIAFGLVEAAVVVYLRANELPVREQTFRDMKHDEVFPLLILANWHAMGRDPMPILKTELAREFATLVMLAAIALPYAKNWRQWFAGFMITFGVWDIFYYVFLKIILGWPASLWTWDILFLLPLPWVGPVITPVIISLVLIGFGVTILWRESQGRPVHFGWLQQLLAFGGGTVVIVAFCWDWQNIAKGGLPNEFHWPLFALGGMIGLAGVFTAVFARPAEQMERSPACSEG